MSTQKRLVIFASGNGSNAETIIRHMSAKGHGSVVRVYCNASQAGVLARAERLQIPTIVFDRKDLGDPECVLAQLQKDAPDLIVLAGFLLKIPEVILAAYPHHIINIHPALLPEFGGKGMYGMHVHQAVKDQGATQTGITVHWVNAAYDEGAIIFQAQTTVGLEDSVADIARKVQTLEQKHFTQVIDRVLRT
ncbi:phosphoribosylglycinamide formyltransferase [Flavobacteriaceae bacterium]|jgi:phosphoribosylglycinamide formyltransferase 1|nr:phosphoribosylglycinamide formyltransferase [Flavobacteriaceae bacterium]